MYSGDQQKKSNEVPKVPYLNRKEETHWWVFWYSSQESVMANSWCFSIQDPGWRLAERLLKLSLLCRLRWVPYFVVIDFNRPLSGRTSRSCRPRGKDVTLPGIASTKRGSNKFSLTEGEVIFIPVFEDVDKMLVLVIHKGFHHSSVSTCLVGNITLPGDEDKLNKMTIS